VGAKVPFDSDRWLAESYESVFDADAFYRQFDRLATAYDSITCALHVEQPRAKQLSFVVGADPGSVAEDYPNFRNLWLERGAEALLGRGVTHDGIHTSVREMERTDYHRYLLKPLGIDHSIGLLCDRFQDGGFSMLSLSRSRRSGPYEDLEVARLNRMRPHFRTLFRLHARAIEQGRRVDRLEAIVARTETPRFQLDARLRVRFANPAAEVILQEADLIFLGPDDVLSIRDRRAAERFATELQSGSAFELLLVSHQTKRRAVLQLEPLRPLSNPGYRAESGYLATLAPMPRALVAPARRLVSLLGLTPREAELAQGLADTLNLRAAAECAGMRYETARSHLKQCFGKTMTSSQMELVALVRDLQGRHGLEA
jgi:DNA-binding CsgD family transcriptional regulator/PAS domain-containing protein